MLNLKQTTSTCLGLVAGSTLAFYAMPADAFSFGNDGILFEKNTMVDFMFMESHGAFKSTLSIVKKNTPTTIEAVLFKENKAAISPANDFLGLCPDTVTSPSGGCQNWFTFEGGVEYSLLLDSGVNKPVGTSGMVYSTDSLNTPTSNQAQFSKNPDGSYLIDFDDKGMGPDRDFNDFTISAKVKSVPEPTALAGLALVGGVLVVSRLRKKD